MPVVRDLPIAVVRVGVVAVGVGDGDGARLPLLWHRLDHVTRNYWMPPNARAVLVRGAGHGVTDLDLPSGTPRPFPAVWTDLESPPVDATGEPVTSDYSLPFAVAAASHPDVTLTFGYAAPAPSTTAPLHVRATLTEGTVAQNALLTDGGSATFRMTTLPAPMVGRYDVSLHVAFEYDRGDGTWGPIATEAVPLRAYGLLGAQTIQINTTAPYAAWVAVADAVAGWIDGSTADPQRVAGQIVHHVYDDLGLHYDTVHGASYYTTYRTGYSGANFDLSAFLERANGTTVNCTDCASIVSTYANMIGCDLGYNIITSNFPLDYIHAIGTPAFTDDPFNTGRPGGFHYHAITSDGDGLVFDATLHEDGDSAPGAPPFEETVIDGLMQDFYLGHLTPAMVLVSHDDKTAIE
jgi:hypothetical protein